MWNFFETSKSSEKYQKVFRSLLLSDLLYLVWAKRALKIQKWVFPHLHFQRRTTHSYHRFCLLHLVTLQSNQAGQGRSRPGYKVSVRLFPVTVWFLCDPIWCPTTAPENSVYSSEFHFFLLKIFLFIFSPKFYENWKIKLLKPKNIVNRLCRVTGNRGLGIGTDRPVHGNQQLAADLKHRVQTHRHIQPHQ